MLELRRLALQRLACFLKEVDRLKEIDFPYESAKDGLTELQQEGMQRLHTLQRLRSDSDLLAVTSMCRSVLEWLYDTVPHLGFILRSTNVRNAFEIHAPLLDLAKLALGENVKLIISSEWEDSPYMYKGVTSLPDFVLIGLPAAESANPLVVPSAGHELGHAIWSARVDDVPYLKRLGDAIFGEIKNTWQAFEQRFSPDFSRDEIDSRVEAYRICEPAFEYAARQAEEYFCDFVGIRLFGISYLYSFAYLLAPGTHQISYYPPMGKRARNLVRCASHYGFGALSEFVDMFPLEIQERDYMTGIADRALDAVLDDLMVEANEVLDLLSISKPDDSVIDRIYKRYATYVVPASDAGSLGNVIGAGWKAYLDERIWVDHPEVQEKFGVLSELVLKNVEVFQIEQQLLREI